MKKRGLETTYDVDNVQILNKDEFEVTYNNGYVRVYKGRIYRIYILPKQTAPNTFLIDFDLIIT